ncbi:protein of unknown function [Maridesulfovibrio hydrothermalis AM13 = DSM 14728]|uniref:SGNH hydrolase-type esterase domain-containing protein n=1 Tax=Maridesulfovibrio hydrothermalis AM13 = DSM 14728 TaxID=1121451 RepID=L0R8X8_9BACT|nr:protein of unknown function [Maridesulfovibrio hydrothermalis AM13 = DSM 14728]
MADTIEYVEYVDAWPTMITKETSQLNPLFTLDGVHLSHEGYMNYASSVLAPIFKQIKN